MRDAARYAFTAEQWDACVQEDDYFHANNTAHTVRVVYVHPARPAGHAELQPWLCVCAAVCRLKIQGLCAVAPLAGWK